MCACVGNFVKFGYNMAEESSTCGDVNYDQSNGKNDTIADQMICNLTKQDIMGMEFDSEVDAQSFYRKYALVMGFSVRLGDHGRNKNNEMIWRKYVCNSEGHRAVKYIENNDRIREHRAVTRCDCKAQMCVRLNKCTSKLYVHNFVEERTHALTGHIHTIALI